MVTDCCVTAYIYDLLSKACKTSQRAGKNRQQFHLTKHVFPAIKRHESKTLNSCNATSKSDVSAEGWYSCTGYSYWHEWTGTGEQHVGCITCYQGFSDINPALCGMRRNLQTVGGWRSQSWFEYKLLLIWARPSHSNYRCSREKPDATRQPTATLNHIIWLKLECYLSDRPLLRLTSLAAWTCCLKRRKAQNLTLAVVNYLRIPPNGIVVWSAPPWHWLGNLTHILAMTESPSRPRTWCSLRECTKRPGNARLACFQDSPQGQRTPTYTFAKKEKKIPPNHFKAQRVG